MTKITLQEGGGKFRLTAAGHATGSREVCAAVSAIVYALANYLQTLELEEGVKAEVFTMRLKSGDTILEAEGGDEVRRAFELTAAGLARIAEDKKYMPYLRVAQTHLPTAEGKEAEWLSRIGRKYWKPAKV